MRLVAETMRGDCAIQLMERGSLRPAAWHTTKGGAELDLTLFHAGVDGGHAGTALRSGGAVLLDRASLELAAEASAGDVSPPRSAIVAPLTFETEVLGLVVVTRGSAHVPYDGDDLEFLVCLIDRVAIALARIGHAVI